MSLTKHWFTFSRVRGDSSLKQTIFFRALPIAMEQPVQTTQVTTPAVGLTRYKFFFPLTIEFWEPSQVIPGKERKSKLLHPDSALYRYLDFIRQQLVQQHPQNIAPKRMDYHIELISQAECDQLNGNTDSTLVSRCQKLQGLVLNPVEIEPQGKVWAMKTPEVDGYGPTHITIAYYPGGIQPAYIIDTTQETLCNQ